MTHDADDRTLEILLVEDNLGDVRLLEMGFDQTNIDETFHVATDGEEALDFLFRRDGYESASHPDVVLLDLNLPKLNGIEVLERMQSRSKLRSVPVVVLTSSQSEDDRATSLERGASAYLSKPVDPSSFVSLAEAIAEFVDSGRLPEPFAE
ncbi:response regulator [Haloprofundus salilacus]|uniref:response regulator n=1 Tax=Haloprofundus salilacus TaxID=2876190 RepID=UPI001CCDE7F9|nr:response regulator [Haloprofundus salilacus]